MNLDPVYMEWGTRSSGVGFFCSHALGDTKQKKPTPLNRGSPLHVNRVLDRIYGHGFFVLSRMLMRKNVNSDVSKDSSILKHNKG